VERLGLGARKAGREEEVGFEVIGDQVLKNK